MHLSSIDRNDGTNVKATTLNVSTCKMLESQQTAAGVSTAAFLLPADALLYDIVLHAQALWNAGTSATGKVGDATDDDGYFTGVNLKATDLAAGESISFIAAGGEQGADLGNVSAADVHVNRRQLTTARTISLIVTTVGTLGTAGITWCHVLWASQPSADRIAATFVAT